MRITGKALVEKERKERKICTDNFSVQKEKDDVSKGSGRGSKNTEHWVGVKMNRGKHS